MNDSFSKNIFFTLAEIFIHEIFFMRLLKVFQTLKPVFSIFLHFTKRKDSRKYEKYCLFHLKGPPFLFSRYSNFCNFFPFIPTFSRFNGLYEFWRYQLANVIFGITQKPLCMNHHYCFGHRSVKKLFF